MQLMNKDSSFNGLSCFLKNYSPVARRLQSVYQSSKGAIHNTFKKEIEMLNLAITLFILAVIAAVLGFGGMAGTLTGFAQIAFGIFVVLFLLSLVSHVVRGRGIRV